MQTFKNLILTFLLTALLFGVSFGSKSFLSASQESIVKEFISIPFSMLTAKLIFMDQKIAASQYYQFMAIVYSTKLQFPHYHITAEHEGHEDECEHEHSKTSPEGEEYVAYAHGADGSDIPLTQKDLEELKKREEYVTQHTSEFIDIKYFYDLIDLVNALDPENEYVLLFGKGWALNVEMSKQMIEVLKNCYKRDPHWRTIFDAGWVSLYNIRNYEEAREYFKLALRHDDAPRFVSGIYSQSFYVDRKYEAAIPQIAEQIRNTKDHDLKTRLEKKFHWYQRLLFLNKAAKRYFEVNNAPIEKLEDLVTSRLIKEIPEDAIGKGFFWDEKNKEVVSRNMFDLVKE